MSEEEKEQQYMNMDDGEYFLDYCTNKACLSFSPTSLIALHPEQQFQIWVVTHLVGVTASSRLDRKNTKYQWIIYSQVTISIIDNKYGPYAQKR